MIQMKEQQEKKGNLYQEGHLGSNANLFLSPYSAQLTLFQLITEEE